MASQTLLQSEHQLHEMAILRSGLNDFGSPGYRQGLRVLLEALDTEMQLTDLGRRAVSDVILRNLISRLYAQKGWVDHPDVLFLHINQPLVITGLPRTGSTALHRLLSVDPQFQGLEAWLSRTPMVRPPRQSWYTYPEYHACVADLERYYKIKPESLRAHQTAADDVEECSRVLTQSFSTGLWSLIFRVPTYDRWLCEASERDSYLRYFDILRLIGARELSKRWLLKCPYHMTHMTTLLEALPNACVIQTHRDPLNVIPSLCSLMHVHWRSLLGEAAQPTSIGSQECAYWRKALDCMQAARQESPARFFDVDHRKLVADPLTVVRSIYDYFGLTLLPQTEIKMHAWAAASPTSSHGKHEYRIDSWGVTPEEICESFADYRAEHQFR